jgi:hypothetical protein
MIKPHQALEGKTPAEKCGIKIEGNYKWLTNHSKCKEGAKK